MPIENTHSYVIQQIMHKFREDRAGFRMTPALLEQWMEEAVNLRNPQPEQIKMPRLAG